MLPGTKRRASQDSFLDALQSQIVTGTENLASWIRHVDANGGIDDLFRLEVWLKGLRSFFEIRHLPLAEAERNDLVGRNFGPEIRIVRDALQRCEIFAAELIKYGRAGNIEFEAFIVSQLRKDSALEYHVGKIAEQPSPLDSMFQLSTSLNDLRLMVDAACRDKRPGYQLFLSIGRNYQRALRSCRYVEMLLAQRFRTQDDRVDNAALGSILRAIEDERLRREVALSLLWLFRLLRYLQVVSDDLAADRPLVPTLVIFSLLHSETEQAADSLRTHFPKGKEGDPALSEAAELIVRSLVSESHRVFEQELVSASREPDPDAIFAAIQRGHDALRNCYQSCIVMLAQAFEKELEPRAVFPGMQENQQKAHRLRKDLWGLREYLRAFLKDKATPDTSSMLERIALFRESAMHDLMYRDWGEFERLSDSLFIAATPPEVRNVLREFVNFLDSLIDDVPARSVPRVTARADIR